VVSLFREKSSAGIFWLIALSSLLHTPFLIHPPQVIAVSGQGILYEIMQPLLFFPPFAMALFYQAIIITQALRLNYILNDARMFSKTAFTAAMSYLLLTALFPAWNNLTPALISNSLLIWLLQRFMKLYNTPNPRASIFNTGLIASCAVLLYHPAVIMIMLAFFALAVLRAFKINEWLVLLMGLITPFYCLFSILFLNDGLKNALYFLPKFHIHSLDNADKIVKLTTSITATVLILAGFFAWQQNITRMIIHVRKNWSVILVMMLFLTMVVFFVKDLQFDVFLLAMVPASIFVSCIFLYPKQSLFPAILFWLTVAVVVYNNWVW
jgi:hypothetical protein